MKSFGLIADCCLFLTPFVIAALMACEPDVRQAEAAPGQADATPQPSRVRVLESRHLSKAFQLVSIVSVDSAEYISLWHGAAIRHERPRGGPVQPPRIRWVESAYQKGAQEIVSIISVDSVEYLIFRRGGIVRHRGAESGAFDMGWRVAPQDVRKD